MGGSLFLFVAIRGSPVVNLGAMEIANQAAVEKPGA